MIKFYPFYDYNKSDRDGSSFDKAMYYTTVSSQNGYVNQDAFLQSNDSTKYFLVDFQNNVQYSINLNKQTSFDGYTYRLRIIGNDLNNNTIFDYQQPYNDDWWYPSNFFSYFKISDNVIKFYTKNQQQEENVFYSVQYNTSSSSNNRLCLSIYPNVESLNITPLPNSFIDSSRKFDENNNYNRQLMIFVKKNSDTSSIGLNTKGLFPTNNLVFYFNFQKYKIKQQSWYYVVQFKSNYGNYTLKSAYSVDGYYQGTPVYLNSVDGYCNKGINTRQFYWGVESSNFILNKNFQQFTLMGYISRNQQGYSWYGYHQTNASFPDLFGFGYNYKEQTNSYYSGNQDNSNKNKGFGFYLQNGKVGIRINDLKYIMNTDKTYQQDNKQEGRLLNNTWYHICMTWNKQYLCGYINGELKLKQRLNGVILYNATKFYIGTSIDQYGYNYYNNGASYYDQDTDSEVNNQCFQCKFDQIALFDKCLNQSLIKTIYKGKIFL